MVRKSTQNYKKGLIAALFFVYPLVLVSQNTEEVLTKSPGQDRHPWWSPNGETIVFESDRDGDWELFTINKDGSGLRKLTDNEANDRNPSWHPQDNSILFESDRSGKLALYRMGLSDLSTEQITLNDFELEPTTARFSPDGERIVFSANESVEGLQLNLFLTEKNGEKVSRLTRDSTRSYYGSWSPDGQKLVFFSRRDTGGEQDELYIMNLAKADHPAQRITTYESHDFCPHWSPTGEYIVFSRSIPEARPELFICKTDGSDQQQITFTLSQGETQAVWSPDGKTIAYAGFRNGNYEICLMAIK